MHVSQAALGRTFILRLEDGDVLPHCLERFAKENGLARAVCLLLGGAGEGRLITGPVDGDAPSITPMVHPLEAVHEAAAVGTIFPDEAGEPKLHMHAALGRGEEALVGCVRHGVAIWKLAEVVVIELTETAMSRRVDPTLGFEVLMPPAPDQDDPA